MHMHMLFFTFYPTVFIHICVYIYIYINIFFLYACVFIHVCLYIFIDFVFIYTLCGYIYIYVCDGRLGIHPATVGLTQMFASGFANDVCKTMS